MTLRLYMIAVNSPRPLTPSFQGLPPGGLDAAIHVHDLDSRILTGPELAEIVDQLEDIATGHKPEPATATIDAPVTAELPPLDDDPYAWRAELEEGP